MQVPQIKEHRESVTSAQAQCGLKRLNDGNHGNHRRIAWNGHSISPKAALIGLGLTTCLVVATLFSRRAYVHYQNGKIEHIACRIGDNINGEMHDFEYYKNSAENRGLATDQYCLAEAFKQGKGTELSLKDARNWYKKAAEQGLTVAQRALCVPEMFPEEDANFNEFEPLCCPDNGPLSLWVPLCIPTQDYFRDAQKGGKRGG